MSTSTQRTGSRPSHHANNSSTSFTNPWPSANAPTWTELLGNSFPLGWYTGDLHNHEKAREVQVVQPDWGRANLVERQLEKSDVVIGTWLGHASALVEFTEGVGEKNLFLLFDPIFSLRAGPTQYTGPSRAKSAPCQVEDLIGCDAVFISHNHYDHLDLSSIKAIGKKFPEAKYFVPLGNKSLLLSMGVPSRLVYEFDWWQEEIFDPTQFGSQEPHESTNGTVFRVSCVPAQHNSGRMGMDQGSTLWCGWVVQRFRTSTREDGMLNMKRNGAIYHAGDTGYRRTAKSDVVCPAFKEIGQKFGLFDMSFVPIWRGGTLGFISYLGLRLSHHDVPATSHCSPADAVAIHLDVKSRNTVGIHFGTFVGSENESLEAMIEFGEACDERGVGGFQDDPDGENGRAGTLNIGESLVVEIGSKDSEIKLDRFDASKGGGAVGATH